MDAKVNGQIEAYLELTKGGELSAHWRLPEGLITVSSGYLETPFEQRQQSTVASSPHQFVGKWQVKGDEIELTVDGAGPRCRKGQGRLECSSEGAQQVFVLMPPGDALPGWVKSTAVQSKSDAVGPSKPFGEWQHGERLAVRVYAEGAPNNQSIRADLDLNDPNGGAVTLVPQAVSVRVAYQGLGAWPVAAITIRNNVTCGTLKLANKLSRWPVALVKGSAEIQVRRVDMNFGCERCSGCEKETEAKSMAFVSGG